MQILNIFHVLVAIALVAFVLIQKGQGATAGASFGAGASATVFGSRGAGTFLTRATWVLAALFCVISLTMAVVVSRTVGVPETNLGVVGDTAVEVSEPEPTVVEQESLTTDGDGSGSSDIPAFENSGDGESGDLPQFSPSDEALDSVDANAVSAEEGLDESLPEPLEEAAEEE